MVLSSKFIVVVDLRRTQSLSRDFLNVADLSLRFTTHISFFQALDGVASELPTPLARPAFSPISLSLIVAFSVAYASSLLCRTYYYLPITSPQNLNPFPSERRQIS